MFPVRQGNIVPVPENRDKAGPPRLNEALAPEMVRIVCGLDNVPTGRCRIQSSRQLRRMKLKCTNIGLGKALAQRTGTKTSPTLGAGTLAGWLFRGPPWAYEPSDLLV